MQYEEIIATLEDVAYPVTEGMQNALAEYVSWRAAGIVSIPLNSECGEESEYMASYYFRSSGYPVTGYILVHGDGEITAIGHCAQEVKDTIIHDL